MRQQSFYILALFLLSAFQTEAQRVKRKGVQPVQTGSKGNKSLSPYTLDQLQGKWQEVSRYASNSVKAVDFPDSLLLKFENNKVELKDVISMNMSLKGVAQIEGDILTVAGDTYTILSLDKNMLVLDDGEFTKKLQHKEQFYYETLGKISVTSDSMNTPITIDPKNVEGKWMVYRRQALAGSVMEDAVVIKSLDIFPGNTIGSATGQVVCYKTDVSESFPCRIIFGKGNIQVITDKYTWDFTTYKADGNEFVFGEAGRLLYYAKHLPATAPNSPLP